MSKKAESSILSRLAAFGGRLTGLGRAEEPAPPAPVIGRDVKKEPAPRFEEQQVGLNLDQFLSAEGGKFSTKLHVVSLAEFREAVAERWDKLADKIHLIVEATIRAHLGHGNTFARQNEDLYVMVFSAVSPSEAKLRAYTIAKELGNRLVGSSRFASGEQPLVYVAEMDVADAMGADGKLDPAALDDAIGAVRAEAAQDPGGRGNAVIGAAGGVVDDAAWLRVLQSAGVLVEEGGLRWHMQPDGTRVAVGDHSLRAHLRPGEAAPAAAPGARAASVASAPDSEPSLRAHLRPAACAPDAEPSLRAHLRPCQPASVDSQPGLRRHMLPAGAPAPTASAAPPPTTSIEPELRDLTIVCRPGWIAATQVIGLYQYLPRAVADNGAAIAGRQLYSGRSAALAVDRRVAARVAADLNAAAPGSQKSLVVLPLHWGTLIQPQRNQVLRTLQDVAAAERDRRLVVEIFGLPAQIAIADLVEAVALLRTLARRVLLRVQAEPERLAWAQAAGVDAIGFDVLDLPLDQREDAALHAVLATVAAVGAANGLPTYVWGLRCRASLMEAVQLGYAMINGPALIREAPSPGQVIRAPRERFV